MTDCSRKGGGCVGKATASGEICAEFCKSDNSLGCKCISIVIQYIFWSLNKQVDEI